MYPLVPSRAPNNSDQDIGEGRRWPAKSIDYLKLTIYDPEKTSPYTWVGSTGDQYGTFGGGTASEAGIHGSIYLHMPHSLNENYNVRYNKATLGPFGGTLEAAMQTAQEGGDMEKITKALQGGANTGAGQLIFNAIGSAFSTANQTMGTDGSVNRDQLLALTKQRVFNPYEETVFEGTNYRSHSFDFDLVPRNGAEVKEIRNIITLLRDSMLPGMDGASNQYLTIPRFFKMSMVRYHPPVKGNISGGEETLDQPAGLSYIMQFPVKMVLTAMDVNLTPGGSHTSLRDMSASAKDQKVDHGPAAYKLNLSFEETAFITRNLLAGGTGYKENWDGKGEDTLSEEDISFLALDTPAEGGDKDGDGGNK